MIPINLLSLRFQADKPANRRPDAVNRKTREIQDALKAAGMDTAFWEESGAMLVDAFHVPHLKRTIVRMDLSGLKPGFGLERLTGALKAALPANVFGDIEIQHRPAKPCCSGGNCLGFGPTTEPDDAGKTGPPRRLLKLV